MPTDTTAATSRQAVYDALVPLLKEQLTPELTFRAAESNDRCDLAAPGPLTVNGREVEELSLAALMVHKGHVGLYLMPAYVCPEFAERLHPDLRKLRSGKSCFQVKRLDDALLGHVRDALQTARELYRENGWIA